MAYPYQPYYYNPYQTQYQMPQYQTQQTQSVSAPTSPTIIWVNGEREASTYPVAPNAAVALWDSQNPCIYLKKADASGRPSMQIYDLVERAETPQNANTAQDIKVYDYATKSDLSALESVLEGSMADMKKEITKIKKRFESEDE